MRKPTPWRDNAGAADPALAGNPTRARRWLEEALADSADIAALRSAAEALADGTDWSRVDDHQLADALTAALAAGQLHAEGQAPQLQRLAPKEAPAPAPPPPPPAAARAAAAAPPPPPAEAEPELDVAAMVAVLTQAAQAGVPFCEECAREAAAA